MRVQISVPVALMSARPMSQRPQNVILADKFIPRLVSNVHQAANPPSVEFPEADVRELCIRTREQFLSEPSFVEINAPVKICGDTHGQYGDLLRMFAFNGWPPDTSYLFLGDYVDRGKQSLETISLLMAYKLKYPSRVFLLRGNHECALINRVYGFFDECKRRYSIGLWKIFQDTFNCMPVAGLVSNRIVCMHGGISPTLVSWDQIRRIKRPTDIPQKGVLCDLLWADPDKLGTGFRENIRGISYTFGADSVKNFCNHFDVDLIVRAHQVVEDGYEFFANRRLVTIFSAPNYCGQFDNAGAVLSVDKNLLCSFQVLKPIDRKKALPPTKIRFETMEPIRVTGDLPGKTAPLEAPPSDAGRTSPPEPPPVVSPPVPPPPPPPTPVKAPETSKTALPSTPSKVPPLEKSLTSEKSGDMNTTTTEESERSAAVQVDSNSSEHQ